MRIAILIFGITCFISVLGYFTIRRPDCHRIDILIDQTDLYLPIPDSEFVTELFSSKNKWSRVVVSIRPINEYSLVESYASTLDTVPIYTRNLLIRKKEIEDIQKEILGSIQKVQNGMRNRTNSVIIDQLLYILNNPPQECHHSIFVFSDFLENSPWLNVYTEASSEGKLANHVRDNLSKIPSENNAEITFITTFRNTIEAKKQTVVIEVLQRVFKEFDINVRIEILKPIISSL